MPERTWPTAGSSSRATTMARQRSPFPARAGSTRGSSTGTSGAPACRVGLRNAEQAADRRGQLEHRAGLVRDRARQRALAPHDEGNRPLAPVEMPVAADSATLAVVGHQDHRGAVEPAALLQELEEAAHVAVGLRDLVEVLGAAHAAHVAELVGREQLEHQQVRVLLLDHPAALGHERAVDLRGRLHGCHRAHDLLAEGIEQVRDPHESAAPALALEHVEHGFAAHAQARSEVRAHSVLGGGGAGEHRREADHRAGRVCGLDREVLRALARELVHHGGMRLPEAFAVAAVHDDHVDAPGECLLHRLARRALRIARQAARERAGGEGAQGCGDRHRRDHPQQRAGARFLGEERARAERDQELRQLFERVAARGI